MTSPTEVIFPPLKSKVVSVFRRPKEEPRELYFRSECKGETLLTKDGVKDSSDWHVEARHRAGPNPAERGILIQSRENLVQLQKQFPTLTTLTPNSFGENLYIEGDLTVDQVCIGDVIGIFRAKKCVGKIRVTSPRTPCLLMDNKHSKPLGEIPQEDRVSGFCIGNGLGGIFCEVIEEGSVASDDILEILSRTRPGWTIARISEVAYGTRENRKARDIVEFNGTESELEELTKMEELAHLEWKDKLQEFIQKKGKEILSQFHFRFLHLRFRLHHFRFRFRLFCFLLFHTACF